MSTRPAQLARLRTRWSAVGAAVAITLGAGGIGLAQAAIDTGDKPVTITIEPERILDTRDDLGLPGAFASETPRDLQVTGDVDVASGAAKKTVVPAGASAVIVNVTVVNPTADGFVSLRPGGATGAPSTSTVNFGPGAVEPNAATVDLSADGKIQIYVFLLGTATSADVLVDVVGYTVDHNHNDIYYTEDEVDAALGLKANSADVYTQAEVDDAVAAARSAAMSATSGAQTLTQNAVSSVVSMPFTPDVDGKLVVNATSVFNVGSPTTDPSLRCSITLTNSLENNAELWLYAAEFDVATQLSGTRLFELAAGVPVTVRLNCGVATGQFVGTEDSILTGIFTPSG